MNIEGGQLGGMTWEIRTDGHTHLRIKYVTAENLPQSPGSSAQAPWWPGWAGNLKQRGHLCTHNWATRLCGANWCYIKATCTSVKINLKKKRKLWYIHTMEYYSAIEKNAIWVNFNEVDETRAYYTEWSESEIETPIQCINAYVWNLESW